MRMFKFPSINSFAHIVNDMREADFPLGEVVRFVGTVKLHGSNGGIVQPSAGAPLYAQSRNRVLPLDDDNMGFAQYVVDTQDEWLAKFADFRAKHAVPDDHIVAIYGEWVGPKINPKVAISKLENRCLLTFAYCVISPEDAELAGTQDFRRVGRWVFDNIDLGDITYEIEIDFTDPESAIEELKARTMAVEDCCPVAAALTGVEGMGEGVVWRPVGVDVNTYRFAFKTKGEKHKKGTGVRKQVKLTPDIIKSIDALVDVVCCDERLLQGWEYLEEMNVPRQKSSTPEFFKWVMSDIAKEEAAVIEASQLPPKAVQRACTIRAREWFFAKIEAF